MEGMSLKGTLVRIVCVREGCWSSFLRIVPVFVGFLRGGSSRWTVCKLQVREIQGFCSSRLEAGSLMLGSGTLLPVCEWKKESTNSYIDGIYSYNYFNNVNAISS